MKRLIAIVFIYACTAGCWAILGTTVFYRSTHQDHRLRSAVGELWGTEQHQAAPSFWYETTQRVERVSPKHSSGDGATAVSVRARTVESATALLAGLRVWQTPGIDSF